MTINIRELREELAAHERDGLGVLSFGVPMVAALLDAVEAARKAETAWWRLQIAEHAGDPGQVSACYRDLDEAMAGLCVLARFDFGDDQ